MDYYVIALLPEAAVPFKGLVTDSLWQEYRKDPDRFIVLGAVRGNRACGILLACVERGVLFIRFLYVEPESRGLGIGWELLAELIAAAASEDILSARCDFIARGEDAASLRGLLEMYGFRFERIDETEYSMTLGELAAIDWPSGSPEACISFSELPDVYLKDLSAYLALNADCPLALPLAREEFDQKLSFVHIRDKKVCAAIFVQDDYGGRLRLSWVFARPELAGAAKVLLTLLQQAFRTAATGRPADTIVDICAINSFSARLIERLCAGNVGDEVVHAALDLQQMREVPAGYRPISIDSIIRDYI